MRGSSKPPKREDIIQMQALAQAGKNPNQIGKLLDWDRKTVVKYLKQELTPDEKKNLETLVKRIKDAELQDLTLLGAKARDHLHKLLDEGKLKPIETVAVIDRTFQQRRLLEGQSTDNISVLVQRYRALSKNEKAKYQKISDQIANELIEKEE